MIQAHPEIQDFEQKHAKTAKKNNLPLTDQSNSFQDLCRRDMRAVINPETFLVRMSFTKAPSSSRSLRASVQTLLFLASESAWTQQR
jgi:hypothetical protein